MGRRLNTKSVMPASIVVLLILLAFTLSMAEGQVDPLSETREKLIGISEEEKQILQNLFILVQEIEEMEKTQKEISREIEIVILEIKSLEKNIKEEEMLYEKNLDRLKQVLKSYQRRGPGSYLEIILDSDNLAMFLRRLNTLRDLSRNTEELLDLTEASREKLAGEKNKLEGKLLSIEEKREQLRLAVEKNLQLKQETEAYLASLGQKKNYYQEHLANIQRVWGELKPMMANITKQFAQLIETGNLSEEALKVSFSLPYMKGSIDEKAFNSIIQQNSILRELVFKFEQDKIQISFPKENLILAGNFEMSKDNTLRFIPTEGSFYHMPLGKGAIEELFQEGYMTLNLKPLVGEYTMKAIEMKDGYLELKILLF